jgi:hypothetical protein
MKNFICFVNGHKIDQDVLSKRIRDDPIFEKSEDPNILPLSRYVIYCIRCGAKLIYDGHYCHSRDQISLYKEE